MLVSSGGVAVLSGLLLYIPAAPIAWANAASCAPTLLGAPAGALCVFVRTFVVGGVTGISTAGDLWRMKICPKSHIRAPNSDLKGCVLDDLAAWGVEGEAFSYTYFLRLYTSR